MILFTSKHGLKSLPNTAVSVGGQQQLQSSSVRDLGVTYDQHLSMTQHVNSYAELDITTSEISGGSFDTSHDAPKTLVRALVTSRLDYV